MKPWDLEFQPPLTPAVLIRRYKRFLADVILPDGQVVTVHVPNSGAMLGVSEPGSRVWLSVAKPGRKLGHTLHFVETQSSWAGVDTMIPNRLVKAALAKGALPGFEGFARFRPEVAYGEASRVDFLLEADEGPPLYLEVKNCHLSRVAGLAEFPDCVAARSSKHMDELATMVDGGARAAVVFIVQRTDCKRFSPARELDPTFAAAALRAAAAGVSFHALQCEMSPAGMRLDGSLAVEL
jgi:sugar fermentation stimulation protein A